MRVLYFAQIAEVAGCREEIWDEPRSLTASEVWEKLTDRHPGLQAWKARCRLAVNQHFLSPGEIILPHSEVAVLPPVSGG